MLKYLIFILAAGYAGAQIIPPSSGGGGGGTYTLTAAKIEAAGGLTNGSATINGSPITNGASFTITGGSGGGISNIAVAGVTGTLSGSGGNVLSSVSLTSLASAGVATNGQMVTLAQLPGAVLTNGQTSVSLNTVPPPNGFEAQANQTVSFNPSTRQATVAPVGSSFRVTTGGRTYTYSGSVTSSAGPDVAGGLYAYFRPSDGAFVCTNVAWNISDGEAQVIFAYMDTNAPASTTLTIDERHGVGISDSDHLMRHLTVGSTWASGMTISHFGADTATAAGADGTNTCIAINDAGVFYDEDIRHTSVINGTSGGSTNTAGVFPILYKNSAGYWRKRAGTQFPFAFSGNVPTYYTSAGVETSVAEDQYFVYWLVAYGSADGTNMFLISHPSTYASTASAQSGATFASLSSVVGGLASTEMLVAYRLIFQFNAAAAGANPVSVKSSKLRMVDDFRNVPGGVIMAGVGSGSGSYVLTADKIAAAGGATNGQPVTLAQLPAEVLTNAAAFATAAQGIAATNAQARVAVLETNAVLRGDTNGWVVSSHASFLTAESDPVFTTNGVKRSDTNGWTVSSHASLVATDDARYLATVTNYAATPFDSAVTITNTSALTVTSYFGHAYSRTFTSTGTITHAFIGTNATAGNEVFMETTATGLPARVWPAGYVFGYSGSISSNAPSPTPWAQMSVQKTPMGSIVWCVTGQVWQAGTP
jgi:hypothetical protein